MTRSFDQKYLIMSLFCLQNGERYISEFTELDNSVEDVKIKELCFDVRASFLFVELIYPFRRYVFSFDNHGNFHRWDFKSDHWFVSFLLREEIADVTKATWDEITDDEYDVIGVDLGIKDLAITSYGETFHNPKAT